MPGLRRLACVAIGFFTQKALVFGAVVGCVGLLLVVRVSWTPDNDPTMRRHGPRPDGPAEYVQWRNLSLRDENGQIAEGGLMKGKAHLDMMRAQPQPMAAAGIARSSWSSVGPGNVGGRVRTIVVHPTQTDTMFLGSVGGGIWKTTNGGTSWIPLDDFLANLAVSTIAMVPGTPDTLFVGTGEGFYNIDGLRGAGIFRSTDGGTSFSQLPATSTTPAAGQSASDYHYVNRLSISPSGTTLLAATRTGIFRSTNGGSTFSRATMVGGGAVLTDGGIDDIDFHPTDNTRAVAATHSGGLLYSTDGGATWRTAVGGPPSGRAELAFASSSPNIVYAGVDLDDGSLYKSVDGGQSYSEVFDGASDITVNPYNAGGGSQGWYDNLVWVSPTDANFIVWGGIDLFRSTNGGVSFSRMSQWYSQNLSNPTSAHADHHVAVAHPNFNGTSNRTVFFGNDGGVYKAADVATVGGGSAPYQTGWTELNNGLTITQFYGGAGHPGTGRITGGTQDNGTLFYNPSVSNANENWNRPFGGDGGFSAYDSVDQNYFYGEYVYLRIHRNSTGGASGSSYIDSGISDANTTNAEFIAAFVKDPNDNNRLLAASVRLYRTNNVKAATPTWEEIKATLGTSDRISAIGVAPGNSDIIYAGHNSGKLYKTTNGTSAAAAVVWTPIDDNGTANPLPARRITRITVDPTNSATVYVTLGGFSGDNIYKSVNGGSSWANITGPSGGSTALPDVPVRDLEVHPTNSNWIYAGTEVGIFASADGGMTWSLPSDGPANVSVDELFFLGTKLVAVTHGRGMFVADTTGTTPSKIISLSGSLAFGDVTVNTTATRTLTISNSGNSTLTVSSISYPAGFSGAWSGTIGAGSSQPVTVTFAPAAVTSYGGTVTVNSDKTSGTNTTSASGAGVAVSTRTIGLSGDLAFGSVAVGTSATRTLTISNSGNSTLTVSSLTYPSGFSGAWAGPIGAGSSQNVTVTFAPSAATSYGGTVTVNSDKTSGTNTISASGVGTGLAPDLFEPDDTAGQASVLVAGVPQSHTFHIAGDSDWARFSAVAGQSFTLTTTNLASGVDTILWLYGADAVTVLGTDDDGGGGLSSQIVFTPSTTGTHYAKVTQYSGTNVGGYSLTLTATATRIISLSGDLAFGSVAVGTSATRTLTISNSGNSTLTVSSLTYPSGFSGAWAGPIGAGSSQNVTVTFAPSAATSYGGTVTVNSDKTSGTNAIPVSGTGTVTAPGPFNHSSPLNGAPGQSSSPTLSWSASAGAASYAYCIDTANDSACNTSWVSVGNATSVGLSGLISGTPYYWHVRATNAGGTTYAEGNGATFWTFTTLGLPGAFAHLNPTNGVTGQSTSPTLSWSTSTGATSYEYCIDVSNNNVCNTTWISTGTATSVGLSGLASNTPYFWQVRALNAAGTTYAQADPEAYWSFATGVRAPGPPLVDLNGDGRGDVFTYRAASGAWARQVTLGGGGFAETMGAWAPGWSILPATFNADALTDLFVYSATTGQWYQMLNTGAGFSVQATGTWWPGWQKFVTDLDGDGLSDLFLYDLASGVWYRALATPGGFTYTSGIWNPGWEITPISLNGDAFGDLFLMDRATGRWFWVTGQANGSFAYPAMGYWQTDWAFYPGDFNGDGLGDWFLYRAQAGQYYVALNTGTGYTYASGSGWAAGWTPMVVDWNADGRSDLLLYNKTTTGQWYQLQGDGAGQFAVVGYGFWNPGWDLAPTDFNGDGRTDLLFYKPGTGEWYQGWNLTTGTFTYVGGLWQSGLTLVVGLLWR